MRRNIELYQDSSLESLTHEMHEIPDSDTIGSCGMQLTGRVLRLGIRFDVSSSK